MAAAIARGTSDACIFAVPSPLAPGDLEACNLRTIPNCSIETRGDACAEQVALDTSRARVEARSRMSSVRVRLAFGVLEHV
jgi:hypothetical protein